MSIPPFFSPSFFGSSASSAVSDFTLITNADPINTLVGDALILLQIAMGGGSPISTPVQPGFSPHLIWQDAHEDSASDSYLISGKIAGPEDIGATYAAMNSLFVMRSSHAAGLVMTGRSNATPGGSEVINSAGLIAPVGFIYETIQTNSTSLGSESVQSLPPDANQASAGFPRLRISAWSKNYHPQEVTLINATENSFRRFIQISGAS